MKKNITINLCGRLFQIDEDAYKLLQHYIESLRSSFGRQEGGDEIVDDIEARIAELFDELRQRGVEAITIDHVKEIITRIGEPEQLTGEEGERPGHIGWQSFVDNMRSRTSGKRLYRNPNDKMVAGVLSGIAAYTGTDPTIWRLATVVLTLCYGAGFLMYLVLAIVLPEAKTPEQKLQMMAREVTPQNLADVVVDKDRQPERRPTLLRLTVSFLLKLGFGLFIALAVLVGIALCIGFLCALVALVMIFTGTMPNFEESGVPDIYRQNPLAVVLFGISLFMLMLIPIYAIIHMILSLTGKTQPMGIWQRIVWIALWIAALCCLVPCTIAMSETANEQHKREINEKYSYQGVPMSASDKHYLQQGGWTLLKHENCGRRYTSENEYYTGDRNMRYLDAFNDDCMEIYQAERKEAVAPGRYRLTCVARAQGRGVFIYALSGESEKHLKEIPAYGNKGGDIFEQALLVDSLATGPEAERMRQTAAANHGKGYGWCQIVIDDIVVSQPDSIAYGVSTDEPFTGQPCASQWFSACDFRLEKVEKPRKK